MQVLGDKCFVKGAHTNKDTHTLREKENSTPVEDL